MPDKVFYFCFILQTKNGSMMNSICLPALLFLSMLSFCSCQTRQFEQENKLENDITLIKDSSDNQGRGLIPLIDLKEGNYYKGQSGGLYGNGSNEIPESHLITLKNKIAEINPVNGKIGFLSIGMSNTSYEFKNFMRLVQLDENKSKYLYLCNGAQGGATADIWADASSRAWINLDERLKESGLTSSQVQVAWLKTAHKQPNISMPDENSDAVQLEKDMIAIIKILIEKFENLKVIYLSSRIFAGYAISDLNPEPYAYESGFAVRNVILEQINNNQSLDPKTTPVLIWGPYLWANGENKNSSGLSWFRSDYDQKDYTHPGRRTGTEKVANLLYEFFITDKFAQQWYYIK